MDRLGRLAPKTSTECSLVSDSKAKLLFMKPEVETFTIKLPDGDRILRFSETVTGVCLEKRLDPKLPVATQKQKWIKVFTEILERELGTTG